MLPNSCHQAGEWHVHSFGLLCYFSWATSLRITAVFGAQAKAMMQVTVIVVLTVAIIRTHHLAKQVTARCAMLQQAELSYATLSLVYNGKI